MSRRHAEQIVRQLLTDVHGHRWLGLVMPHSFTVEELSVEERRYPFAPELQRDCRVSVTCGVPVLYSPDSSRGMLRAALPAHRDNVEAFRNLLTAYAARSPGRLKLSDFRVSPGEPPAPYLPNGEPNGPPADWSVTAVLDVA